MDRAEILAAIRRTAQANGGIPLGHDRLTEIGIPPSVWGRYWPRLSAAQREAGVEPNKKNEARPEEDALAHLVRFVREIGAIPTSRDRVVKRNEDPTFPSERVWKRTPRPICGDPSRTRGCPRSLCWSVPSRRAERLQGSGRSFRLCLPAEGPGQPLQDRPDQCLWPEAERARHPVAFRHAQARYRSDGGQEGRQGGRC